MLLILFYLLIVFLIYYFFSKSKKENKLKKEKTKKIKKEKFSYDYSPNEYKHYVEGFNIPRPAYKVDTNFDDTVIFDINKKILNSNAKNINQLFTDIVDDNYKLVNNLNKTIPNESSKRPLYVNLYYNPKSEKKYIFSTELPKLGFYKQYNTQNKVSKVPKVSKSPKSPKIENNNINNIISQIQNLVLFKDSDSKIKKSPIKDKKNKN